MQVLLEIREYDALVLEILACDISALLYEGELASVIEIQNKYFVSGILCIFYLLQIDHMLYVFPDNVSIIGGGYIFLSVNKVIETTEPAF